MIWNDSGFKDAYRAKLKQADASSEAELQAQALAFQAETARLGGSRPEHFLQRAGNAAAAMLSGYAKGALDAFDGVITSIEAELEEADLNALRESLEQEIARRSKALPASLRDFSRPAAHPALLRNILQQAPVKARQILAERVAASRDRIRTRVRAQELLDRAIFVGHDVQDADVAEAVKAVILEAVGADAPLYTSSELHGLRQGRDGHQRALAQLKKNRMTLAVVTPQSTGNPWLWWQAGVAAGCGKPVFVLHAKGMGAAAALPIDPEQHIDLSRRDDVVRLLQAVQVDLRRSPADPATIDLGEVVTRSRPS